MWMFEFHLGMVVRFISCLYFLYWHLWQQSYVNQCSTFQWMRVYPCQIFECIHSIVKRWRFKFVEWNVNLVLFCVVILCTCCELFFFHTPSICGKCRRLLNNNKINIKIISTCLSILLMAYLPTYFFLLSRWQKALGARHIICIHCWCMSMMWEWIHDMNLAGGSHDQILCYTHLPMFYFGCGFNW